jgi:hypothetical protein
MATKERIAEAVDNEGWQKFRLRMKGRPTWVKLEMLEEYFTANAPMQIVLGNVEVDMNDDVCVRVDNYIKSLCRGGQLYAGESLETAIKNNWKLAVKK